MSRNAVRPAIMKFLESRPGVHVYREEIAEATKLGETQIVNCMSQLRRETERGILSFPIDVVIAGRCWVYRPGTKSNKSTSSTKRVFEEIGTSRSGSIVIQDESGKLYRAEEL